VPNQRIPLTIVDGEYETTVTVARGANVRETLRDHGFSPYGSVSAMANCGGRGYCGTCGVSVDPEPSPAHWHDATAFRFGYPRLSCQLSVNEPMTVELVEKIVWGQLRPRSHRRRLDR